MVGGSYGGEVQFAAASIDKRIDTIVPLITWNDLSYSFAPNNTSQLKPALDGVSTSTPGAGKLVWALGFFGLGAADGAQNAPTDPGRLLGCPNFSTFVCPTLVYAATTGTLTTYQTNQLRHASVTSYMGKVKAPTLIIQGQSDTLFNLNEGVANYRALKAQGTPTKMIWFNGGHSGPSAPGELETGSPGSRHAARDGPHHRTGSTTTSRAPRSAPGRSSPTSATGCPTPATRPRRTPTARPTRSAPRSRTSCPARSWSRASRRSPPAPRGSSPLAGGLPSSFDELDAVRQLPLPPIPLPETDLPGTFATFTSAPSTAKVDVVGSPRLKLKVDAPTAVATQGLNPGKLVLFVKVLDVDSTGKATLIRNLVAPVRVPDVRKAFNVTLPAFVHRFEPGHSIRLVVAGGSTNYRGGLAPTPVSIPTGSTAQVLTLPVVP